MDERREAHSETYDTLIDHVETRRLERERDNKKKHFDAKLEKLAQTTVDFEQKYGKDHDMTTLLTTFLDVALEMKNLMETMTAINVAVGLHAQPIITLFEKGVTIFSSIH